MLLGTAEVRAQRGIDSQLFRPAMDNYGIVTVERAETSRQFDWGFKVYLNYAGNPLRLSLYDDTTMMNKPQVVMSRQAAINFQAHVGLTDWLELALDVPVSTQGYTDAYGKFGSAADPMLQRTGFYAAQGFTNIPPPDAAPLDMRLGLKARIFRRGIVGLALAAVMTVPFGDESAFLGDNNVTFRPNLIFDITKGNFTLALNVGAIIRQTTNIFDPRDQAMGVQSPRVILSVGHELTFGLGAAYRFVRWVGLFAETYGFMALTDWQGVPRDHTLDVLGGLQFFPRQDLAITLGAGAGVLVNAARHDEYRAVLGLAWTPEAGINRRARAEGSPNVDTDGDGIPDSQDLCPNDPEDKDGFEDDDGCPDIDNDQDGIPDRDDKCPNEPEDRDGFQDDDGCPEPDNDKDGIPDTMDKCPNEPEDKDGFQDEDGCPDPDNDGDGIPDTIDKCPNEPETKNGVDDDDGCPDSGGVQTPTRGQPLPKLVLLFDANQAQPTKATAAYLDKLADALRQNPGIRRVRIEGHTDDKEAPAKKLQALSQARATAVRDALMKRGVEGDRLQAVGYGAARPTDTGKTAAAHAKNRRVELVGVE
jgi:outer membrane protein OmpA-like peptidoglycan-associated protein